MNFLSTVLSFFPFFLLLLSKNIRFGNNNKFYHRVLKATLNTAKYRHNFSRMDLAI
ncbi:hypothetical protein EVA_17795 [gut metagenome]|uniref:Uncharacterized protein n=1 Tax=gut metagenome TaxID=749906 RepID=J9FX01_9ZZZZ